MSSARQVLDALAQHGASVVIRGDKPKLILPVGKKLPADLIDAARAHRDELRALAEQPKPTPASPGTAWDSDDWRAFFDEAAGIAEFDNGLSRAEAEASCLRVLRHRVVEPQPQTIAAGALRRLSSWRATR